MTYGGPLAKTLTNLKVPGRLAFELAPDGEALQKLYATLGLHCMARCLSRWCTTVLLTLWASMLQVFSLASCVASFASAPIIVFFAPDGGLAAKLGLAGLMCGVHSSCALVVDF